MSGLAASRAGAAPMMVWGAGAQRADNHVTDVWRVLDPGPRHHTCAIVGDPLVLRVIGEIWVSGNSSAGTLPTRKGAEGYYVWVALPM
jgi:hypothetical protein